MKETLYQHAFGDCHVGTKQYWLGVLKEQLEFEEDEKLSCLTPEQLFDYYIDTVTLCEAVRAELKPRSKSLFLSWYFENVDLDCISHDINMLLEKAESQAVKGVSFHVGSLSTYSGKEVTFTFYDEDFFWDEPEE
jgi:hypothetical protein